MTFPRCMKNLIPRQGFQARKLQSFRRLICAYLPSKEKLLKQKRIQLRFRACCRKYLKPTGKRCLNCRRNNRTHKFLFLFLNFSYFLNSFPNPIMKLSIAPTAFATFSLLFIFFFSSRSFSFFPSSFPILPSPSSINFLP